MEVIVNVSAWLRREREMCSNLDSSAYYLLNLPTVNI